MVSRNVPPRAAVTTIIPAVGGPSRTTFHSSGEKAAFVVMPRSYAHRHGWGPIQHLTGCLRPAVGSAAQQLGLGLGELLVGEHALLVQRRDLLQLIGHRRPGCGRGLGRRGLLLLELADAVVLVGLVRGALIRGPGHMLARQVSAPADRGGAQERASSSEHLVLLLSDGNRRQLTAAHGEA